MDEAVNPIAAPRYYRTAQHPTNKSPRREDEKRRGSPSREMIYDEQPLPASASLLSRLAGNLAEACRGKGRNRVFGETPRGNRWSIIRGEEAMMNIARYSRHSLH